VRVRTRTRTPTLSYRGVTTKKLDLLYAGGGRLTAAPARTSERISAFFERVCVGGGR
jgi:hypothetical protein